MAVMAGSVVLLALSAAGSAADAGHYSSAGWMTAVIVLSVVLGLVVAATSLRRAPAAPRAGDRGLLRAFSAPGCSTASRASR